MSQVEVALEDRRQHGEFPAGLHSSHFEQPRHQSVFTVHYLPRHFSQQGSTYDPVTKETHFLVAVSPNVTRVELLVRPAGQGAEYDAEVVPMARHSAATGGFGISLGSLPPGSQYAFRLIGRGDEVIASHCADPYALAETRFEWDRRPGKFLSRAGEAIETIAQPGDTLDQKLGRAFQSERSRFLDLIGSAPQLTDYSAPWSITIDTSKLLSPAEMNVPQPHELGERVICKFHPLHSVGVPDHFISPEFWDKRGKLDLLLDPVFREHLKSSWNTIEFFPLNAVVPCAELAAVGRAPVWGYMPSQLFALNPDYFASSDPHEQILTLQKVVNALKEDGFSVIVDLVPFHNPEKRNTGPVYSLAALDQKRYFLLDDNGNDVDLSGCGNTFNVSHPDVQNLILAQSRHFVELFGLDRRIDQAAIAHLPPGAKEGYDPDSAFANQLYSVGPCIIEGGHAKGLYFRDAGALKDIPGVAFKKFDERNLTDQKAFGLPGDPYNGETVLSSRAFARAGSVGGHHAEQRRLPLSQNRGVSVFPHDGMTPFDRAEIFSLLVLAKQLDNAEIKTLAEDVRRSNSYESRLENMGKLLDFAQKNFPNELFEARVNSAQYLMASQYLNPGDILTVFGDHLCRTQDGNGNAFDRTDFLHNAGTLSDEPRFASAQNDMSMLVHRLLLLRERYDFVFKNVNIFDGVTRSSSHAEFATSLAWFGKDGNPIVSEAAWRRGKGAAVRDFLGVVYHSERETDNVMQPHSDLYVAESGLPRSIKLPPLADGYVWRRILDSTEPTAPSGDSRVRPGGSYRFTNPGIAVFESVALD